MLPTVDSTEGQSSGADNGTIRATAAEIGYLCMMIALIPVGPP